MVLKLLDRSAEVSLQDPLWLNKHLLSIIDAVDNIDVISFTDHTSQLIMKAVEQLDNTGQDTANRAVHRDLWYLLAMDKKIWVVLWEKYDDLVSLLIEYSSLNRMPPRDHLLSYTLENPSWEYERSYTWFPEEQVFIGSLRESYKDLYLAIQSILQILHSSWEDDIIPHLWEIRKRLEVLPNEMRRVNAELPKERFAELLKSSFHSIEINGVVYASPCWGALPIIIIDRLLYGDQLTDEEDKIYKSFVGHFIPYLPSELRDIVSNQSVFHVVQDRWIDAEKAQLSEVFKVLIKFRWPHYGAAKRNIPAIKRLWVWTWSFWENPLLWIININRRLLNQLS